MCGGGQGHSEGLGLGDSQVTGIGRTKDIWRADGEQQVAKINMCVCVPGD